MINNDIKNELLKSAGKSLLNLPVLNFLADAIEVRSKVKQQRAIEFITDLTEYLNVQQLIEVNYQRLKSEAFADLLDEAIQNVAASSSKKKAKLFKTVLAAHILSQTEPRLTEVYLKIIARLTEKQILILDGLSQASGKDFMHLHEQIHLIQTEIRTLTAENKREIKYIKDDSQVAGRNKMVSDKRIQIEKLRFQANANKWHSFKTYHCEEDEYYFLVQDLFNNGLITDMGTGIGADPFRVVEINQMGRDILTFLETESSGCPEHPHSYTM